MEQELKRCKQMFNQLIEASHGLPTPSLINRPLTISAQILGKRPKSSTTEEPNFSDMMRESHLRQMEERGPEQVSMGDRDE